MIKNDINNVISALELYSNELKIIVNEINQDADNGDIDYRIIKLQLEQIYDIYSSILTLLKEQKISSTNVLLRVLFESHIQLVYIIQDKEAVPGKVIIYRIFMYKEELRNLERKYRISGISESNKRELAEQIVNIKKGLNRFYKSFKNKKIADRFKNRKKYSNWYSVYNDKTMSIEQLANKVKLCNCKNKTWGIFYESLYQQLSIYTHGHKGFEFVGKPARQDELYESVIYLVGTACFYIFEDLFAWLNETGYINDRVRTKINIKNLIVAQGIIKSTFKPESGK